MKKKKFTHEVVLIQKNGFGEVIDRHVVAMFCSIHWAKRFIESNLPNGTDRCYLCIEEI